MRRPNPVGFVKGHFRLFVGLAIGIVTGVLLRGRLDGEASFSIAWNAGAWLYFALSGILVANATPKSMRENARTTDEGKFLILVLISLAALATIGAIGVQLGEARALAGPERFFHILLAAATILTAWLLVHLVFALHYAHEYYDEFEMEAGKPPELRGGLVFPETQSPDYYDFLYFSYVIGTSSQTADIAVSSGVMRRTVLVHCVLAFFFNNAVLALTINLAAGLI